MGILSIIQKGIKAMIDEANTPESFKMGEKFEDYVRDFLFIDSYYDLLEKTHDYKSNSRDYIQSSLNPDYKFKDRRAKKEFYIEAKFRTGDDGKGKVKWCNDKQLVRYQHINMTIPVFLILGMGEKADYPEYLSLVPLNIAKYSGLFYSVLDKYEIKIDEPVTSNILWKR